jgi:hypothetical protein
MYQYPHTIENKFGEKLVFVDRIKEPDGDKLITEGFVEPNAGPPIHVHWKQEESLTVISGKMGTLIPDRNPFIMVQVKQQLLCVAPGISSGTPAKMNYM